MEHIPQILGALLGYLLGGLSVALLMYIKFNGRLLVQETRLNLHVEQEQAWQERIDGRLDRIILHLGVTEEVIT